jgi:two-component system sensor histidine kinase/response regulator
MPDKKIEIPTHIDLERFISVQAHDLRTPFNHITGFSKMLLNTLGTEPFSDLQREDLGTVFRSGMRALMLVNGLIDIARINGNEKELNPREINLEQAVGLGLAQWKKFNPDSEVQVETCLPDPAATVQADEQLIRQIIHGFIALVAQYCEAETKVLVTAEQEPGEAVFTFTSTGKKARQPSELDLEMQGYVGRAFVELHGGQIRQAIETDQGAIIQFCLPKA